MIKKANQSMVPDLKRIWKECFHDEDWYIDFYYENRFPQVSTFVYLIDEQAVSMLTLIECEVVKGKNTKKACYIYAVATLPQYQGKGYAKELIQYVNQDEMPYEDTFLVPATKDLFGYYEKLGYHTVCNKGIKRITMEPNGMDQVEHKVTMDELTAFDLYQFREQRYADMGYIRWDLNGLAYLILEWQKCKGKAVKVTVDDKVGSMFYYYDSIEQKLFIKEITLDFSYMSYILQDLSHTMIIKEVQIQYPASEITEGEVVPFVMSYADACNDLSYVNFVKD